MYVAGPPTWPYRALTELQCVHVSVPPSTQLSSVPGFRVRAVMHPPAWDAITRMPGVCPTTNHAGADVFLLESVFRNDVWSHMESPVSEENERNVCTSMIEVRACCSNAHVLGSLWW